MKKIPLRNKKNKSIFALVDDAVFAFLSQWSWYRLRGGYAVRKQRYPEPHPGRMVYMHRVIMQTPEGKFTDHLNGNKEDNRRENLRVCSKAENGWNTGKPKTNKSGFKGVRFDKRKKVKKWRARLVANGKEIHIGYFKDKLEAVHAHNEAAKKYHGEFAQTNFSN